MNKIAIFGKPANGKSTLARNLASATGIKLYALDSILYTQDGEQISGKRYEELHKSIIDSGEWIIEGFAPLNSLTSFFQRIDAADTLIYVDLPYHVTYWLVIKRFFKGLFVSPEGWPEGSSIFKGTLETFRTLRLCPKFWNDDFRIRLEKQSSKKSLHVIRSISELNDYVAVMAR